RNGGETNRAEESARRILSSGNAEEIEIFAIPTSILITAVFKNEVITRSVSVRDRDINLGNIDVLNTISRNISSGKLTVEQAFLQLEKLYKKPANAYLLGFFSSVSSGAFSALFGGGLIDVGLSFLAALATNVSIKIFKKTTGYSFLTALFASILTAIFARVAVFFVPQANLPALIIGGIMPILPGLSFTNAVRDTINGDIVSGSSKGTEAALQAVAIAVGVGIALI
ncbi:MAG: threonine/serine exporter family protein, partial [Clostridia bacterium]